ncbi:uncharacterized protein LOC121388638 [Gigantopelta aegis]|uniref:uncharacterized protein LOC121388638 n=1 Tax=Gigantopelta aegis TaxID=1735272 RepID=UPI001B888E5E|nr:uncharacterized protein LOC121388638 [Gigantopelta aegis]
MGIKKKKGGKKKKASKASGSEKHEDTPRAADQDTLMSMSQGTSMAASPSGKDKKKGKKKKLKKDEKVQEKLEKAIRKLKENPVYFHSFLGRMDRWLVGVAPTVVEIFKQLDQDGEGVVSYDDFKAGMCDLNVPLNKIELHLFTTLLDKDNAGEVCYMDLTKGLQYTKEIEDVELDGLEQEDTLILTERNFETCSHCKMLIDGPYKEKNPKFILLTLRLVTFDNMKNHPGHITVLVHTHIPVFGLIQIIVQQTSILSNKLAVFSDKTRSKDCRLPPENTLEEYGFRGGRREDPEEALLYYDYTVEFNDCPLLLCDHYFGQNVKV